MRRVRIYVHDVVTHTVVEKQDEKNVSMIDNIRTKRKT